MELFWSIMDSARKEGHGNLDAMYDHLLLLLEELEEPDILLWHQIFVEYRSMARRERLTALTCAVMGGCGPEDCDAFTAWLIAQGKQVYLAVLRDPASLPQWANPEDAALEYGDLLRIGPSACMRRNQSSVWDHKPFYELLLQYPMSGELKTRIRQEIRYAPDIDDGWSKETLPEIFPALFPECD